MKRRAPPGDYAPQETPVTKAIRLTEPTSARVAALIRKLEIVFRDAGLYRQVVSRTRGSDAQSLLDTFQWLLDRPELDLCSKFRGSLIVATQRLSRKSGLYPACYELRGVVQESLDPVAAGGFADIYKGTFEGQAVCMKVVRIYQNTDIEHFLKRFSKEAILWGQLMHPNVLPIYGLYRFRNSICLVSPWMNQGDITQFLRNNPQASRHRLAVDVSEGLLYLHKNGIIHGDLKGPNILVNDAGVACLADFGISSVSDSEIPAWTSHSSAASKGGSVRWQAPELFDMEGDQMVKNSKASDVYALSCVFYEIFTGGLPFPHILRDTVLMLQIKAGTRPTRPEETSPAWHQWGLTESMWSLMEESWKEVPSERPTIEMVIEQLYSALCRDDHPRKSESVLRPSSFRQRMIGVFDITTVSDIMSLDLQHFNPSLGPGMMPKLPPPPSSASSSAPGGPSLPPSQVPPSYSSAGPSSSHHTAISEPSVPPHAGTLVPIEPGTAGFLDDLGIHAIPPELKKEGDTWFAIFNPNAKRELDVSLVHTLMHESVVCCVRFSADGKFLATGCNRTAQIYDTKTGARTCVLVDKSAGKAGDLYIRSVCFSPDGKFLATGAEDKLIRIWDIKKKRIRNIFDGHQQEIYSLDFSSDGRLIVSGSGDKTARIWDMLDGSSKVLTINDPHSLKNEDGATSVAISPNGQLVAVGSLGAVVSIWDMATAQLVERLHGHRHSVYSVAFTPDGKGLVSGSLDKTLKYWDVSGLITGVKSWKQGTNGAGPVNGPGGAPGAVGRKEVEKGSQCTMNFTGHKDYVLAVAASPDGKWVVSGSKDRGVQFWDSRTATVQCMLQGHNNSVTSVDLSPAGSIFATGSGDCQARIWSYNTI